MTAFKSQTILADSDCAEGQAGLPSWNEDGVGTIAYLDALLAAPFPTFTFSAAGASAY
jgi:hypothetical protein